MTYEAKVKIQFDSKWTPGLYSDPDMLPEEHIVMEMPAEDLNTSQYFRWFSNFLRAIGHNDIGIMKGACSVAFNEFNSEEDMRKVADEYDVYLAEDYEKRVEERVENELEIRAEWDRINSMKEPKIKGDWDVLTDEEKAKCWEQRYWGIYHRFGKFAKYTDSQLDTIIAVYESQNNSTDAQLDVPSF